MDLYRIIDILLLFIADIKLQVPEVSCKDLSCPQNDIANQNRLTQFSLVIQEYYIPMNCLNNLISLDKNLLIGQPKENRRGQQSIHRNTEAPFV
jgi:hypothetical protein